MEQKFYICKHCGNIIAKVKDTGVPVICCGEPMSDSINSYLPESISVVNSILSANEAKFSTDKYLSIVLSIFFPPFRHYSIIFSS